MATVTRQPFAPLHGARLQSLTSLKNRQNALPNSSAAKRKASELLEVDNFENVDPSLFSKRSKASDSSFSSQDIFKPSSFLMTKASSVPNLSNGISLLTSPVKPADALSYTPPSRPRTYLQPKSPAARLTTSLAQSSSPQSAPAGRSPTRGSKRIGLLTTRRRASGSPSRLDAPSWNSSPAVPFSLDAALKGTISSYAPRTSLESSMPLPDAHEPGMKASWFFDIHEDSPEQEMTNLLQHSTCVLDISSDEESEVKARRDRAEGRDKENVPPSDDVSQTTRASRGDASSANLDDMLVEKTRDPLAEMNAADFYGAGCDGSEVVIIPGEDDEGLGEHSAATAPPPSLIPAETCTFAPDLNCEVDVKVHVDQLMVKSDEPAVKAAVLEPIEGTGESFELWESGSAKDEDEALPSPAPVATSAACLCPE